MDPNATLRMIFEEYEDRNSDPEDMLEFVQALRNWMDKNGFAPNLGKLSAQHQRIMTQVFTDAMLLDCKSRI